MLGFVVERERPHSVAEIRKPAVVQSFSRIQKSNHEIKSTATILETTGLDVLDKKSLDSNIDVVSSMSKEEMEMALSEIRSLLSIKNIEFLKNSKINFSSAESAVNGGHNSVTDDTYSLLNDRFPETLIEMFDIDGSKVFDINFLKDRIVKSWTELLELKNITVKIDLLNLSSVIIDLFCNTKLFSLTTSAKPDNCLNFETIFKVCCLQLFMRCLLL